MGIAADRAYEAHAAYVRSVLRSCGAESHDLDDLTHDTFVAVYSTLDRYDASRPIRPWLWGFAVRIASDHRKRARHHREVAYAELDPPDGRPTTEELLMMHESKQVVAAALAAVPPRSRIVLVMHEIEETPMREIARILSISVNTAYSRLRLARKRFRREVVRSIAVVEKKVTIVGGRPQRLSGISNALIDG